MLLEEYIKETQDTIVRALSMYDEIPNYSTWSQNYIRRYKDSDIFDEIFDKILEQAISYGFVDVSSVFGDSC